jgi:hypothetical protein
VGDERAQGADHDPLEAEASQGLRIGVHRGLLHTFPHLDASEGLFMLIVHHLGKSQSERIVWLCEELVIPYELKCYARDPVTMLAPPDYKALHPIGAAPVITDGEVVLAESGAVVEYIIAKY